MGEPVGYQGAQPEQWLASVGDISISQHWVMTPTGTYPIRGTVWTMDDRTYWHESVSQTGVILAIVGALFVCLLSLFFLLMKDRKMAGYIQVTVQGNGFHHSTMVPGTSPQFLMSVHQTVNYARALAAAA